MPPTDAPTSLRFEHRTGEDPVVGIGTATPRLSWWIPRADVDFEQTAYQAELVRDDAAPETVTVESAEQILVSWPAAPLLSRQRVRIRVRVRSADGWSDWSTYAGVEAGLLKTEDWTARFVSPPPLADGQQPSAPVLSGTVEVPPDVVRARL